MYRWIASFSLLLLCGCFFRSYQPVNLYDLNLSGIKLSTNGSLYLLEFRNDSCTGNRMCKRLLDGRVVHDNDNRWVLSPGELVPNAINPQLAGKSGIQPLLIRGIITNFEVIESSGSFLLAGGYCAAKKPQIKYTFQIEIPLSERSPKGIAAAASAAAGKLARQLAEQKWSL